VLSGTKPELSASTSGTSSRTTAAGPWRVFMANKKIQFSCSPLGNSRVIFYFRKSYFQPYAVPAMSVYSSSIWPTSYMASVAARSRDIPFATFALPSCEHPYLQLQFDGKALGGK
jgi:hypothetical protein